MIRSALLALPLAFAIAGSAVAQDGYMPLAEGNTWTYDVKAITKTAGFGVEARSSATATCQSVKTIDGLSYHRIVWVHSKGDLNHDVWIRADNGGIRIAATSSRQHLLLLPGNLDGGPAHVEIVAGGASITLDRLKVGAAESVTVPAGTYTAVPVTNSVKVTAVDIDTTVWYVRGVGAVKVVESVRTAGMVEVRRELLLKTFNGSAPPAVPATPEPPSAPAEPAPSGEPKPTPYKAPGPASRPLAGGRVASSLVEALVDKGPGGGRQDGVAALVREAVKRSGAGLYAATIEPLLTVPLQTIHRRGPFATDTRIEERRVYAGGFRTTSRVSDSVLVVRGPLVSTSTLTDSVVVVLGDVKVEGYIKDCVILCMGKLQCDGYVKDSLVVVLGDMKVDAYLKDSVVQTGGKLTVDAYTKENVLLNGTHPNTPRSKNDRKVSGSPLDLLK